MPIYKYTAKDITGKKVRGTAKAENSSLLMAHLAEKQIFITNTVEINIEAKKNRLNSSELAELSRDLGTMISAGIILIRAISIIINRENNSAKLKKVYLDIYHSLKNGTSFSDSLRAQGTAFPELFISMVYAGEVSGQIDKTLMKMALYYDKENRLKKRVSNATIYPKILIIITTLVVIGIFTFILPNFFKMFEDMELPLPTRVILSISNVLIEYWYVILGLITIIIIIIYLLLQRKEVRIFIDKTKLRTPFIKKLIKIIYTARFARTISTLYDSGLTLVNSVQAAAGTVGNRYIASQFGDVLNKVKSGIPLSTAITSVNGFDTKLSSVIMIGEETGRLSDMLNSVADSFDYESEASTQRLIAIMEPVMIIIMAVIICLIMLAVMLPLLEVYQNMG